MTRRRNVQNAGTALSRLAESVVVDRSLRIVDSHTGGEPTRTVVEGLPDLGPGTMAERRARMRESFDHVRTAILDEPRSSPIVVGAVLTPPVNPDSCAGVIFINNVGYLGMCGHGTIGVAVTLGYLGRIAAGSHRIDTPVGTVTFEYDGRQGVRFDNVPAYRYRTGVSVPLPDGETVIGDIAWGGNWFFLTPEYRLPLERGSIPALHRRATAIRRALEASGVSGADGGVIDHIELTGPPPEAGLGHATPSLTATRAGGDVYCEANARNFVLCPGGEYDRSPCGTGTSAKLACLAADGHLFPGETWRQDSVLGSRFVASYRPVDDAERAAGSVPADLPPETPVIIPTISGTAFVTLDASVIIDPADPFAWGLSRGGPPLADNDVSRTV